MGRRNDYVSQNDMTKKEYEKEKSKRNGVAICARVAKKDINN